jgi:hypothetical protein
MLDRIYDLYDELERQRIMLSFKGDLNPELTGALLDVLEHKMSLLEEDARKRKRVFNVVMECLQNLYHHNARVRVEEGRITPTDEPHGVVMIAKQDDGYSVLTGNFMNASEVERLREHLDKINALAPDELRSFYKDVLTNGQFTSSGGGGLGMIDIARKSGGKLGYEFVPFNKDKAFFSLNVNVTP